MGCGILHSATTPEESQVVDSPWTVFRDRSGEREGVGFGDVNGFLEAVSFCFCEDEGDEP